MKKGQKRRTWTPEEKAEIVNKHLTEHVSVRTLEKEYHAESSFVHKRHPGNPFAALHTSKHLSEEDRLRLMVAKLEIENERLKKGYWTEGVGADKVYVTGSEKNMK